MSFEIRSIFLLLWTSLVFIGKSNENPALPRPTPQELQQRYGDALEAIFGVGIRLQALLEDPDVANSKNFLVSPLSVSLLIAQMMLGAEGRFRDDLYNLLSLPATNEQKQSVIHYFNKKKKSNATYSLPYAKLHLQMGNLVRALEGNEISRSFTLNCTNALFANKNLQLNDEFLNHLKIYETEVRPMNFSTDPVGSQKTINDWASTQTNGVIKAILHQPLPVTASAIFTNAIYFKAEWETPFSYEMNFRAPFQTDKEKFVQVEFMRGFFENIYYGESKKLGCKMIALPYKNRELAMYFMLPNADLAFNINKFTEKLKAADVLELIDQMKSHAVSIQIPKLRLSNSLSILEPLRKYEAFVDQSKNKSEGRENDSLEVLTKRMRAYTSFNATTETELILSGAAAGKTFKVTDVLQEVTLSVDEEGTEAAAVSAGILDYIGGSKNFRAERPFLFFIRHEVTSATLFWGTIVDPTQSQ